MPKVKTPKKETKNKDLSNILWEVIKDFNPAHPNYGVVVSFLVSYMQGLQKENKE